jgi:hypothetical protein|tara:strand:- start:165 stop:368 length:204 start_codon:yes stop_codon:yes gene_type:complete
MPYCDVPCGNLTDDNIDWIMELANQRVIEELKNLQVGIPTGTDGTLMFIRLNKKIQELKQIKNNQEN